MFELDISPAPNGELGDDFPSPASSFSSASLVAGNARPTATSLLLLLWLTGVASEVEEESSAAANEASALAAEGRHEGSSSVSSFSGAVARTSCLRGSSSGCAIVGGS